MEACCSYLTAAWLSTGKLVGHLADMGLDGKQFRNYKPGVTRQDCILAWSASLRLGPSAGI